MSVSHRSHSAIFATFPWHGWDVLMMRHGKFCKYIGPFIQGGCSCDKFTVWQVASVL